MTLFSRFFFTLPVHIWSRRFLLPLGAQSCFFSWLRYRHIRTATRKPSREVGLRSLRRAHLAVERYFPITGSHRPPVSYSQQCTTVHWTLRTSWIARVCPVKKLFLFVANMPLIPSVSNSLTQGIDPVLIVLRK